MDANDLRDKYLQSILQYLDIEAIIPHLIEAELVTKDEEDDLLNDGGGRSEHERIGAWVTKATKKGPTCIPRFVACLILSKSAGGHEQLLNEIEPSLDASVKRQLHRHSLRLTSPSDFRTNYISMLIKRLDPVAITPHLVRAGLLQKHEEEHLLNRNITITRRMLKLVDNLGRRGQDCVPKFLHCLSVTRKAGGHQELLQQMKESEAEICDHHSGVSLIPPPFPTGATNLRLPQAPTNVVCTSNYIAGSQPRHISDYEELISFMCDRLNMVFGQLYKATGLFLPHEQYSNLQECTSVMTFRSLHSCLSELGLFNPIEIDSLIVLLAEVEMPSLVEVLLNYAAKIRYTDATMIVADSVNNLTHPPAGYFFLYISHTNKPLTALDVWDTKEVLSTILMGRSTDRGQFWFRGFLSDKRTIIWQFLSAHEQRVIHAIETSIEIESIAELVQLKHSANMEMVTVYPRELPSVSYSGLGKRNLHVTETTMEGDVFKRSRMQQWNVPAPLSSMTTAHIPQQQPHSPLPVESFNPTITSFCDVEQSTVSAITVSTMDDSTNEDSLKPIALLRNKLQVQYTKTNWSSSITTGPKSQNEMFVQLALVKKQNFSSEDKAKDDYFRKFLRGSVDDILLKKERVKLKTLFSEKRCSKKFVLIEGAPGIGKTRLACYLCTKWAKGELLKQYNLVIFVPLRRFQAECSTNQSVHTFIRLYLNSEKGKRASEELANNGCRNTLLILEGWDELAPEYRSEPSFFHDIISDNSPDFQNASIIVTSRCSVSSSLYDYADKRVEVLGFDSKQVDEYIATHIPPTQKDLVLSHFKKFPNIRALSHIPLTLSIICNILQEHGSLPVTLTELYDLYIRNNLLSGLRKSKALKRELFGVSSLDDLPEEVAKDFTKLTKLAMNGFVNDKLVFRKRHLTEQKLKVEPGYDAYGLLSTIPCHVGAGNEVYYQFRHLTMQEFLAAKYIVDLKRVFEKLKYLSDYRLEPKYQVVWKFFSGITHLSDKEMRQCIISKTNTNNNKDVMFLLHCVYEAHSVDVCLEAALHLKRKLKLNNHSLNTTDCLCLAYVLAQSGGEWHIKMRGCNMGSIGISMFYSQLIDQQEQSTVKLSISTLDLMHNVLHLDATNDCPSGVDVLSSLIRGPIVVGHLILNSNALGDERTRQLAEALKTNTSMHTLSMAACALTSLGAKHLAEMLYLNKTLKSIFLRWNRIGAEGAEHFARVLTENHTLEELFIGDNEIGEKGYTELCEMLKVNRGLKELRIEGTPVNDCQCHEIVEFMPSNRSLELLDLTRSKLGDVGIKIIAEGLKRYQQCSLRKLHVMDCDISDNGVKVLCELIDQELLKSLRLGRNRNITDKSISKLMGVLNNNKTLEHLGLENCDISAECQQQLESLKGIDITFVPYIHLDCSIRAFAAMDEFEEPKYTEEDLVKIAESSNPIPTPDDLRKSLAAFISQVVVLLHTVKDEEMIAALKYLSPPVEQSDKPIRWFHGNASFILGIFGGHKAALVQTSKGADCQPELMLALESLSNAKLIITLGFAYGLKSKCNLGDVLVSTSIDGIGNIRLEHGILKFNEGHVRQTRMSTRALNVFTKGIILWRKFICSMEGRKTKVVAGPLISSPVLLNDKAALDEYLKNNERYEGGETEGQEVAHAQLTLKERDRREVDFIVIKGVADFGDGSKEKGWQLTATLAAARYAEEKLRESGGNVYNCESDHDGARARGERRMEDHFEIASYLKDLPVEQLKQLGLVLGLYYPTLKKMENFPDDMVHAWLVQSDGVIEVSGEPTFEKLAMALEKIGQKGVAYDVRHAKRKSTMSCDVREVKREIESGEETELKVMNKFGLERDDLNFRCPSSILNGIAGEIVDDWDMIGQALDVSTEELKSIPQDHSHSSPKQKAAAMLDTWAEEKGREATYLKLAEALHKCKKISTLEKFYEEVKPEVEKRRDMTMLSAQQESNLSLKEQKTTTSDDIKSEIQRRSEKAKRMIPPQNTATSLDQPVTKHHTRVKLMLSESKTETTQQSAAFQEARTVAKIPFLHHQVLECDSSGQEFNITKHDITVEIPKGSVSEGKKLCLEVGVAMYGPFKFTEPDDSQPISPILWLCFLNKDVKVNKPFKITLPHFLTGLIESRLREHRVSFAKANHNDYVPQEDNIMYNFAPSEDETQFISRNDKSYGVLETTHCCFLCIQAKKTPLLAQDATYCLTRVERITSRGIEINFAATYFLDTCTEALKKQYPIEDRYKIVLRKIFKFMDSEAVPLKITVPENEDKYIVQKDPHGLEILASDIDFWCKELHDMLLEDKLQIYPPRVIMEVILITPNPLTIVMKFSGSQNDRRLDVELALPLGDVIAGNRRRECESESEETVSIIPKVVKSGPIRDCDRLFKDMSKEIGDKYEDVGIDLGIAYQILQNKLETVQFNTLPVNKKAMKMLHLWKEHIAKEKFTYSVLAAALEKNDLTHCADKYCYTTANASEQ